MAISQTFRIFYWSTFHPYKCQSSFRKVGFSSI